MPTAKPSPTSRPERTTTANPSTTPAATDAEPTATARDKQAAVSATQTAKAVIRALTPSVTPLGTLPPEEQIAVFAVERCVDGNVDASLPARLQQGITRMTISPDGQVVVFAFIPDKRESFEGYEELWAVNADGSNLRYLVSTEEMQWHAPDDARVDRLYALEWLPNSHKLIFNMGLFERAVSYNDVNLVDADTGEYQLVRPPAGNGFLGETAGGELYPSPDGQHIAYVTPLSVHVVDLDGTQRPNLLTYDLIQTFSEYHVFAHPAWMPDSSGMWVAIPPATGETNLEVYAVPLNGSPLGLANLPLERTDIEQAGPRVLKAVVSPTGEYVAYLQRTSPTESLYLARLDGTSNEVYAEDSSLWFYYWLDAAKFIFVNPDTTFLGEIGQAPVTIGGEGRVGCNP